MVEHFILKGNSSERLKTINKILKQKYPDSYQVLYQNDSNFSDGNLIFQCNDISNNPIKFYLDTDNNYLYAMAGTGYSSGASLIQETNFFITNQMYSATIHFYVGDAFILLDFEFPGVNGFFLIGKTVTSRTIGIGSTYWKNTWKDTNQILDLDTLNRIEVIDIITPLYNNEGHPFLLPLWFSGNTIDNNNELWMNNDIPDTIPEVFLSTYRKDNDNTRIINSNSYLSPRDLWSNGKEVFKTSLYCESKEGVLNE